MFAATMIALGILGLIKGNYTPAWQPIPQAVPTYEVLAYLCACISVACGLGLLWQRTAVIAARVLLAYLLIWVAVFRVPEVLPAPMVLGSWYSCAESAVIVAGAWVLYAWCAAAWDRRHLGFATGNKGVRIARALYSLSLIFFGTSHFVYLDQTTPLVPGWLPSHLFWAYLTGGAYIAAGVAILIGVSAGLAAVLAAFQIGMFTLLVWLPIVAAGSHDPFQWSETILSWVLTAAAWVLADSYRVRPLACDYVNLSASSNQSS